MAKRIRRPMPAAANRLRRQSALWSILKLHVEPLEPRWLLSNVLTYHNDNVSSGVNSTEPLLTPANVNVNTFAKQFSTSVDGQVYAQPLYMENVNITAGPSPGLHNVVFVATEHDSLYAIDGDSGNQLWKDSFINAAAGITTVPQPDVISGDITVEIGITGTPVIDPSTNMLYVTAKTKEIIGGDNNNPHFVYRLHKVNIQSGADTSIVIADTTRNVNTGAYTYNSGPYVVGTGDGGINVGGQNRVYFNALRQMIRPGAVLLNGHIYLAAASHGDNFPYHGWVLGYDAVTLAITGALNTTPNGGLGGIWQGGGITAVDPQGFFYFETGNGSFNQNAANFNAQGFPIDGDYGDSFVKIGLDATTTPTSQNVNGWGFEVVDYFTPFNQAALNSVDTDLGSGGPIVLPDSVGSVAHPHLLLGGGKEGKIYLIDRDTGMGHTMGKFDAATDNVVQTQASAANISGVNGILSTPAFFNNTIYYVGGYGDRPKTFSISNGALSTSWTSIASGSNYGFPGSTPSISANGTANGIVWTLDRGADATGVSNTLRAFNANSFATLLYTSGQAANNRDQMVGSIVKFTVPTVANGRVYVGTSNSLVVYGPPTPPTTTPAAPTILTATSQFSSEVDLAWQDNATNEATYIIERSPNGIDNWTIVGTVGVNSSSFIDNTVQALTTYYYRVKANNQLGDSPYSNIANATTSATPNLGTGDGLLGVYYDNMNFTGTSISRVDTTINFNWGAGSPDPAIGVNTFSVRWTGLIQAQFSETYTFYTQSDDGVRLLVNNQSVIDNFTDHGSTENTGTFAMIAGQTYTIKMEFYENGGDALAQLRWSSASITKQVIPQSQLFSGAAPATPTNLVAAPASGTQVNLAWTDTSNNETSFKIERKTGAGGTYAEIDQVAPNTASYMDTALMENTTYFYRIKAGNFGSDSAYSNEASVTTPIPPLTPSNAQTTLVAPNRINITWQDNSNNEDSFRVFRKTGAGTFIIVGSLAPNSTTFDDVNAQPGTFYDYHIQAGNLAGFSDFAGLNLTTPADVAPVAVNDSFTVVEGASLVQNTTTNVNFVVTGDTWKYRDNNSNLGTAWKEASYNDAAWSSGPSELGYGDAAPPENRPEATVVSYGPDTANKYVTTYFRRSFQVTDPASITSLTLELLRDDGAAVYLNGAEIARDNLVDSAAFNQYAGYAVAGAEESQFFTFTVNPGLLFSGTNVLAVEIHQANATSSDISFDLHLKGVRRTAGVLANDTDAETTPAMGLTTSVAANPTHGALSIDNRGLFTYTPAAQFSGIDSFTYKTSDGFLDSNLATVTITVTPLQFQVINTDNSGAGSLRQAITDANAASPVEHVISFNITGGNPHQIQLPASDLPAITNPVSFDIPSGSVVEVGTANIFTLGNFVSLTKTGAGTLTIAGSQVRTAASALTVSGGTLNLNSDGGTFLTVNANANGATNLGSTQRLAALNVGAGATASITAGGSKVLALNALSIAGVSDAWTGRLELNDNDLVLHSTGANKAADTARLTNLIKSGFAGGAWNGTGISSASAAGVDNKTTAIGVRLNDDGAGQPVYASFSGQAVNADDVLAKYTFYGDMSLNGVVDGTDYAMIDNGFNFGLTGWVNGDVNYSGAVDGTDYAFVDNAFNFQAGVVLSAGVPSAVGIGPTEAPTARSGNAPASNNGPVPAKALSPAAVSAALADDWMIQHPRSEATDTATETAVADTELWSLDENLVDAAVGDLLRAHFPD